MREYLAVLDDVASGGATPVVPKRLAAGVAYGSVGNLAWFVEEKGIELHIPVFGRSARKPCSGINKDGFIRNPSRKADC